MFFDSKIWPIGRRSLGPRPLEAAYFLRNLKIARSTAPCSRDPEFGLALALTVTLGVVMQSKSLLTVPWPRTLFRGFAMTLAVILFAVSGSGCLHAQTCNDWKAVTGWQGTYTLTSNGNVTHGETNQFSISETSGATVNMPSQTDGLCNQLRWQGADLNNTGSVNDSTQVLNACMQGQWFTTDTLVGNSGFPSNSELVVDATNGTFSFQPIPTIM